MGAMSTAGNIGREAMGRLWEKGAYKAGGAVTDATAGFLPPEAAAGAGYATNVGIQAIPAIAFGEAAKLASPVLRSGSEQLIRSALKPGNKAVATGQAGRAVNTILDEGVNVTNGGARVLQDRITGMNSQIADALRSSNATIDKGAAGSRITDTLRKFENQVDPSADVKTIQDTLARFLNNPNQPNPLPVQQAQAIKQGTYNVLQGKFGEAGSAATEAQKALARGLKEEIASAVPSVAPLNARESDLINALKLVQRRNAVAGNKDPLGLVPLAHDPVAAAGFLASRSEWVKSMLARLLNAGKEQIPANIGRAIGGVVGAQEGQQ